SLSRATILLEQGTIRRKRRLPQLTAAWTRPYGKSEVAERLTQSRPPAHRRIGDEPTSRRAGRGRAVSRDRLARQAAGSRLWELMRAGRLKQFAARAVGRTYRFNMADVESLVRRQAGGGFNTLARTR